MVNDLKMDKYKTHLENGRMWIQVEYINDDKDALFPSGTWERVEDYKYSLSCGVER